MASPQDFLSEFSNRLNTSINESEVRQSFCTALSNTHQIDLKTERDRIDARRNRILLEFKDKGLFNGSSSSNKFQEAYDQLIDNYIPNQATSDGADFYEYIGVAIDGIHYAFVFYERNGSHRHTNLVRLNENSVVLLINAILNDDRRYFSIENLLDDFGPKSEIAISMISSLSSDLDLSISNSKPQKVNMLFQEWQRLFSQASNLGQVGRERIDDYLTSVGFTRPINYTQALFTLHTYNAILFKLIAAELVTSIKFEKYSGFAVYASSLPNGKLVEILNQRIEESEIFKAHGFDNFIEGTFFSWYIENPSEDLVNSIRLLLNRLSLYVLPNSKEAIVGDIVKAVYQGLVPDALRRNIGEFYTPEWLVEFVLNEINYTGYSIIGKKILDPCCGSGNFIIHAISRLKDESMQKGSSAEETLELILSSIFGLDLNPLAIIASRLNYLLAILDLLPISSRIEIPIYLADAVYAPKLTSRNGSHVRTYKIGTVLDTIELMLPEELVLMQPQFSDLLNIIETDVELDTETEIFLQHVERNPNLKDQLLEYPEWKDFIIDMFEKIREMERRNWNRVWCRIVRNYFSSITIGEVEYIASNPPWVRWSALPEEYRTLIKPTCDQYGIFSSTPFFGGNELDISGMIAYTVADRWLKLKGKLGFIITQIHFQAPSSEGFRSFKLPDGTPLEVETVHDLTAVNPFHGPTNKPAVFTWTKGRETRYPVQYKIWRKDTSESIPENSRLSQINDRLISEEKQAYSLEPDKRWSILSTSRSSLLSKLSGGSSYWIGRKGITTDLNAAFFVEIVSAGSKPNTVLISTQPSWGRKPVPQIDHLIEIDLIYPLLKGASQIGPFQYEEIEAVAIVPNIQISSIMPENQFKNNYPEAYKYFNRLNNVTLPDGTPLLEGRSTWKSRMSSTDAPFYSIYNVGPYTFRNYKVVWAEISSGFSASVISNQYIPNINSTKVIIPDHKVYFSSTNNKEEAHYLCALMNSEPVKTFIDSFTVKLQVGTLFKHLNLPPFELSEQTHRDLAKCSQKAHSDRLDEALENKINDLSWKIIRTM